MSPALTAFPRCSLKSAYWLVALRVPDEDEAADGFFLLRDVIAVRSIFEAVTFSYSKRLSYLDLVKVLVAA